jgi:hypothetical protein
MSAPPALIDDERYAALPATFFIIGAIDGEAFLGKQNASCRRASSILQQKRSLAPAP